MTGIAGVDNDGVYRGGGQCSSEKCRSKSMLSVKTEVISQRQDEQPFNLTQQSHAATQAHMKDACLL